MYPRPRGPVGPVHFCSHPSRCGVNSRKARGRGPQQFPEGASAAPRRAPAGRSAIHTPSGRRLPGIALPGAGAGGAARPREPLVATRWRPARRPRPGGRIMRVMRCDTARTKAD